MAHHRDRAAPMIDTLPETMRAVEISAPGGPEVLQEIRAPLPTPGEHEVLIHVQAAGVNRPDILQRIGAYPVPEDASPLPGLEVAGEIVACGSGARRWQKGSRVMALTHGGGYAEFCRVHEDHCLPVPAPLSMVEAAAIPETFFTVWYNVFMRAGLASGETMLVHGGSSGIGTAAIQLATAMGASVIVTAGSEDKCRFCLELGAIHAINYRESDWEQALRAKQGDTGVDVVLDMVAGSYMQKNIRDPLISYFTAALRAARGRTRRSLKVMATVLAESCNDVLARAGRNPLICLFLLTGRVGMSE